MRRRAPPAPGLPGTDLVPNARTLLPRGHAPVSHAGSETRLGLREAVLIVEQAALHAQSLATLLAEVLTELTDLTPAVDCTDSTGVAFQTRTAPLSPREREVLALVAEGRSNKAIAAALFVSPNTIKTHVASLLTKLDADTRAQLAAIAAGDVRRGEC